MTVRKTLGLYANVRPCIAYSPYIQTYHPNMNIVIVRENEEDLYAGIEHQQTPEVIQCLKLISRPGCERIIRYAFEYAVQNNRKKVSCFSKDNIMKLTDGLFHKVFNEIKTEYPQIETDHWIIDIATARLAVKPEQFDVIVTLNLYGDIISDVAAEITGSVGLGGSANIGDHCAMFEAIHGSAPDIAGKNIANPSGLLLGAVMMLVHIGQPEVAEKIHNAWLKTIEEGYHTGDIYNPQLSKEKMTTDKFADAVIAHLGQQPSTMTPVHYQHASQQKKIVGHLSPKQLPKRELVGVDVFLYWEPKDINAYAEKVLALIPDDLELPIITSRGTKVWPEGIPETFCADHLRCRIMAKNGKLNPQSIVKLLESLTQGQIDFIKTENLYFFDGQPGYTKAQGE